jgi:hypothetical protein
MGPEASRSGKPSGHRGVHRLREAIGHDHVQHRGPLFGSATAVVVQRTQRLFAPRRIGHGCSSPRGSAARSSSADATILRMISARLFAHRNRAFWPVRNPLDRARDAFRRDGERRG